MALPHRRQNLAKFIQFHDLTVQEVADHLGITATEVYNICKGLRYPSPREIKGLAEILSLPIEVLLEPDMLKYRDAESWPPHGAGFRTPRQS